MCIIDLQEQHIYIYITGIDSSYIKMSTSLSSSLYDRDLSQGFDTLSIHAGQTKDGDSSTGCYYDRRWPYWSIAFLTAMLPFTIQFLVIIIHQNALYCTIFKATKLPNG